MVGSWSLFASSVRKRRFHLHWAGGNGPCERGLSLRHTMWTPGQST
jgi:hypothetical protein